MYRQGVPGAVCIILLLFFVAVSKGCHQGRSHGEEDDDDCIDAETGEECRNVKTRRKRQASIPMENFFAQCLRNRLRSARFYFPSVVDYMIRYGGWYEKTNGRYCATDTVDCWRDLTNYFLKSDSQLLQPAKSCIMQYGFMNGQIATYAGYRIGLTQPRRQTLEVNPNEFMGLFRAQMPRLPPGDQSLTAMGSLVNFFQSEYACSADFCDCRGLRLPPGERCGDSWLTRLVGATKPSSMRRAALNAANTAISNTMQRNNRRSRNNNNPLQTLLLVQLLNGMFRDSGGGILGRTTTTTTAATTSTTTTEATTTGCRPSGTDTCPT